MTLCAIDVRMTLTMIGLQRCATPSHRIDIPSQQTTVPHSDNRHFPRLTEMTLSATMPENDYQSRQLNNVVGSYQRFMSC